MVHKQDCTAECGCIYAWQHSVQCTVGSVLATSQFTVLFIGNRFLYRHGKMQVSGQDQTLRTRRICSVNHAYTADMMAENQQSAKHIQSTKCASQQAKIPAFNVCKHHLCHFQRPKATRQVAPIKADMLTAAKVPAPLVGAGVGVGDESAFTSAHEGTKLSL